MIILWSSSVITLIKKIKLYLINYCHLLPTVFYFLKKKSIYFSFCKSKWLRGETFQVPQSYYFFFNYLFIFTFFLSNFFLSGWSLFMESNLIYHLYKHFHQSPVLNDIIPNVIYYIRIKFSSLKLSSSYYYTKTFCA